MTHLNSVLSEPKERAEERNIWSLHDSKTLLFDSLINITRMNLRVQFLEP